MTRCAVLTANGRGAVATVAVHGAQAVELVNRLFFPRSGRAFAQVAENRIVVGCWGAEPGEEVVVARRGEQLVEVHCHGGIAANEAILVSLEQLGAVRQSWQDMITELAEDTIAAQASIALAQATTERTAGILLDQYHGALRRSLQQLLGRLHAHDLIHATRIVQELLQYSPLGQYLIVPWKIVLAGPPNAGKSSLINAMLGYQRSIVFDQPGTTRDVLHALTTLEGWPVELTDTAGLRDSEDLLEQAGVQRARQQIQQADLALLLLDVTAADWQLAAESVCDAYEQAILVLNKVDLLGPDTIGTERAESVSQLAPRSVHRISALTGQGVEQLLADIVRHLLPVIPPAGTAVPFTMEQFTQL